MMEGKFKTNSCLSCSLLPFANQITFRSQTSGVPRLIFRIPHIKLVMMHTLDNKKPCPCIPVYIHQSLRVKLLRIPVAQYLLVSHFRRMSIIFQMIFIRRCPSTYIFRAYQSPLSPADCGQNVSRFRIWNPATIPVYPDNLPQSTST